MTVYPLSLKNLNKALFWPNKNDCFTKWDEFLALGIPTACMECLEWWAFDILILITGVIGVEEQAANVIIMNIVFDASMIAYGMQEALTTLVGNCIGANQVKLSKKITFAKNRVKYYIVAPSELVWMCAKHFSHETVRKNYASHPSETENENGF